MSECAGSDCKHPSHQTVLLPGQVSALARLPVDTQSALIDYIAETQHRPLTPADRIVLPLRMKKLTRIAAAGARPEQPRQRGDGR